MARNMTFQVSLKLLTKNFQNGVKTIQNSLGRLRQQFSTFVGGIGLGLGVKELIDNAKSLDKAQTTLRNVSKNTEAYSENLKFVQTLSKRYNQDLIGLMGNFAKFHAAADYANMSLEEQQHIYEALTRASAYFNLTADETNGVFLAIQQMISKGRVSSEELRRQLGERLPGAMNLAAESLGVTTAKLDEMLRLGQVTAKEMLPLLASELNKLTTNLDVNTIQGFSNKLKNTFTELVDRLNVKDMYKDFLGGASNAFDELADKLSSASVSIRKWVERISNLFFFLAKNITTIIGTIGFSKLLQGATNAWTSFFKKIETNLDASTAKMKIYKRELDTLAKASNITYTTNAKTGRIGVNPKAQAAGVDPKAVAEAQAAARAYNSELRTSARLGNQLNNKWSTIGASIWKSVRNIAKFVGLQLAFTAISTALTLIISKTVQWFRKLNEIKRKTKEIKEDLQEDLNRVSIDEVEVEGLYIKEDDTLDRRKRKIEQINKLLGLTGKLAFTEKTTNEKINAALEERYAFLKRNKEIEAKRKYLSDLETEWNRQAGENTKKSDIEAKIASNNAQIDKISKENVRNEKAFYSQQARISKIKNENHRLEQLITLWDDIEAAREEINDLLFSSNTDGSGKNKNLRDLGGDEESTQKKYQKIQQKYNEDLRSLDKQLKDKIITEKQYDDALWDLNLKTLESIYGLEGINVETDAFAKKIRSAVVGSERLGENYKKLIQTNEDYSRGVINLKNQYDLGIITQEEYIEALIDLKASTVKAFASMGKLDGATKKLAEELLDMKKTQANKEAADIISKEMPTLGKRDTFQDYKKKDSEKYEELADIYEDYREKLERLVEKIADVQEKNPTEKNADMLEELTVLLERASQNAETFSQAAKFAEVQEDVKKLKQELNEGIWDNITGIATAAERLTNSWKSLTETMDDPDASGWEKFLTIFTTLISTIETIVGVIRTFQNAMKIAEALSLATAAAEQAQIPVKVQDAIVTKTQAIATKELAVARHMAQAASVPFPANIAAIATTSGALAAAFAAIPAFAQGGIVKGASSVGDKNLIRVNGGEAVLTKAQQATLWHLLDGQTTALAKTKSNVEFKIRGSELVGVLNNYSKKISK